MADNPWTDYDSEMAVKKMTRELINGAIIFSGLHRVLWIIGNPDVTVVDIMSTYLSGQIKFPEPEISVTVNKEKGTIDFEAKVRLFNQQGSAE